MSLLSNTVLTTTWRARQDELRMDRLQHASDLLYELLAEDFETRAGAIQDSLLDVMRTATNPSQLSVPLWTYKTARYDDAWPDVVRDPCFEEMESILRKKGYVWQIGLAEWCFDPAYVTTSDRHGDWSQSWVTPPRKVSEIILQTDICQRLSLLFGPNAQVKSRVVGWSKPAEAMDITVFDLELRLHYWPKGAPTNGREAVRQKYDMHPPPLLGMYQRTQLWTGVPVLGPRTPPMTAMPAPPRLPQRTNGGGIRNPEEEGDVTKRLFPPSPGGTLCAHSPPSCYCGCGYESE